MTVVPVDLLRAAEAERQRASSPPRAVPTLALTGAALAVLALWIGFFLFLIPAMMR